MSFASVCLFRAAFGATAALYPPAPQLDTRPPAPLPLESFHWGVCELRGRRTAGVPLPDLPAMAEAQHRQALAGHSRDKSEQRISFHPLDQADSCRKWGRDAGLPSGR
jgi:hypothetical protein